MVERINGKTILTTPISAEDLKGIKIRVQDMKSQTDMLTALGGTPVAMSYGDIYTSLSTCLLYTSPSPRDS